MNTGSGRFAIGFLVGLLLFLALNLLAAHLNSDCGLPAILGTAGCADDIKRAGFPMQFWEEGGFAFRSVFSATALLVDVLIGLALSLVVGWIAQAYIRGRRRGAT